MRIKLLDKDAIVPTKAYNDDAGWDLYATEDKVLEPGERYLFKHGFAIEIPYGYFGLIRPRSGLASKQGILLATSGVVDAGYRGEIMTCLYNSNTLNRSDHLIKSVEIKKGDRIAQMVIIPVFMDTLEVVNELSDSHRGNGGHGSTG